MFACNRVRCWCWYSRRHVWNGHILWWLTVCEQQRSAFPFPCCTERAALRDTADIITRTCAYCIHGLRYRQVSIALRDVLRLISFDCFTAQLNCSHHYQHRPRLGHVWKQIAALSIAFFFFSLAYGITHSVNQVGSAGVPLSFDGIMLHCRNYWIYFWEHWQ